LSATQFHQVGDKLNPGTSDKSIFTLNPVTGVLRLSAGRNLNYDIQRKYHLEIIAYDTQKPVEFQASLNVTLYVEPSLDKLPIFEPMYNNKTQVTMYRRSLSESMVNNDYVVDIIRAIDPNLCTRFGRGS
jgi:hypothetical protein